MNAQIFPRFAGQTVLVTGAGTGFGAEIAVRAAQEGARVGVHFNRSEAGARKTAERIEALGGEAFVVQADISDWEEVKRLRDEVFDTVDTLDVLVNNVGDVATDLMSWRDLTPATLDRVVDVDVKGTLTMVHEFGGRMVEQGHGAIVNIGSTVIVRGSSRAPVYAAGKYALLGITKSYAAALAPAVRVNIFAPGFMETEATLARSDWQAGRREKLISQTPLGTIPAPEVVAGTALFLASDDASHITGAYMLADGGFNMVGA
ncbi:SDR family NAD(P)-dependent oxidoreductase [Leifsonia shinshuensis]|uniref:NAD(P)-dependent dehydrogenase (Short-subunit alcohol dehydrogenase family) n=1 Tax=Leifsonia shinshuensis TaxID=150026 RepID=A0A853D112_9MICO|nr:SDR family oxidoreductase [Leifsonia shinshuensis]NYJ25813.1 NAD(P)-dependent dehydrogenase (short-subunit alcohol dehydrogenase family) [Leifsonia shinshuensis]